MRKQHSHPKQGPPTGARQDKARALAKFLRKDGLEVLSRGDWNNAADLADLLSTATATEAQLSWLLKPKGRP